MIVKIIGGELTFTLNSGFFRLGWADTNKQTHLKKALQIEPDNVGPMNDLAWILATQKEGRIREPDEATRLLGARSFLIDW